MNSLKAKLNVTYCCSQALYWMTYCTIISTASGYLAAYSYSSTELGLILAVSYAISTALQQILAGFIDKSKKITLAALMLVILAVLGLCEAFLFTCSSRSVAMTGVFTIMAVWIMTLQPLINAYCFTLSKNGEAVNFGVARSMGSLFFSVMSLIVGNILEFRSANLAALAGFIVIILMAISIIIANSFAKGHAINADTTSAETISESVTVEKTNLIKKYSTFFIFLAGIVCFTYGHSLINSFWHQITGEVGGNDGDMGGLLAVQAIVELPAMIFFNKLKDKFGTKNLLIMAAIMYSVKAGVTFLAGSVPMLYFSVLFEAFAFAIFIPGGVQLVNEELDGRDAVKGQAFITGAITIAYLLSNVSGGLLIDNLGVKMALLAGFIVSSVGSLISFIGLVKMKKTY